MHGGQYKRLSRKENPPSWPTCTPGPSKACSSSSTTLRRSTSSPNSVEGLKTAAKKVFEGVDGENAGAVQLADLDLDAYLHRFRIAEGRKYAPDTIAVYGRRIKQAIEAQRQYVETGDMPTFKTTGTKPGASKTNGNGSAAKRKKGNGSPAVATPASQPTAELLEFPFPLHGGVIAEVVLPPRLDPEDVTRINQFVQALSYEQRKQIPAHTGEADDLAA